MPARVRLKEATMRKSHVPQEVVRLNGAAFRLNPAVVRAGKLETLLDEVLSRVLGGTQQTATCVQYTCNLYAPG
jgi:hypothetical protein